MTLHEQILKLEKDLAWSREKLGTEQKTSAMLREEKERLERELLTKNQQIISSRFEIKQLQERLAHSPGPDTDAICFKLLSKETSDALQALHIIEQCLWKFNLEPRDVRAIAAFLARRGEEE